MSDIDLHYPHAVAPVAGETLEVAPGVLWLRMPMPFPPGHINLWLLRDGEGWAVVDTGLATVAVKDLWHQLLQRYRLTRLICTHYHHDHAGLAGWLCQQAGIRLSMAQAEYQALQKAWQRGADSEKEAGFYLAAGLPAASLAAAIDSFRDGDFIATPPASVTPLADGDVLAIGSHRWRVMTYAGHAPEHALLYSATLGVLIAGDQLLPKITPSVGLNAANRLSDPLGEWLASMQALQNLPASTLVLPSHQLPFVGAASRAGQIARYHRQQLAKLSVLLQGPPASAYALAQALFSRLGNPVAELMAVSETLAHLRYLQLRGQASYALTAEGCQHWSAICCESTLQG
ncbi:MBL fold metallo-hydrolase [Craterilacuibacter sp. RT1T]|uniref:MBL fold metallo-hydrolase n=1 Tax=Craterilacuibacter sp. RT1T TaxID=2942211 RepID=UPI0020C14328|nr:MBL fold metallo-hydrolase [Craterilacuibacter sp. RT1T]MCL6262994.1 MBL fold metallo-hydrolase [Craterilacuibacter sp. RT1T]